MGKIVDIFVNDISSIRTGRASPGLIENVVVTVYNGQKMRLQELGSISVPDARSIVFEAWDQAIIREISNGIQAANIGMDAGGGWKFDQVKFTNVDSRTEGRLCEIIGKKIRRRQGNDP